jgi:hypothetical protein
MTLQGRASGRLGLAPFCAKAAAFGGAALLSIAAVAAFRDPAIVGQTTFVLDGNRIYAELEFVRPDTSVHRALAYVDMGSETMTIRAGANLPGPARRAG